MIGISLSNDSNQHVFFKCEIKPLPQHWTNCTNHIHITSTLKMDGSPQMSCDGVTVAKQIEVEDPVEEMAVKMIRDAAVRISEAAGDGTTTATLLAQTMINAGLKKVEAGMNPMDIKRGIDKAVKAVTEKLKQMAIPVSTDSAKIEQVASISAGKAFTK